MTAEGDNSVLMQKVAKERLGDLMKKRPSMPKAPASKELTNRDFLLYLMQVRELKLFTELGEKMVAAGKDGTFTTWMLQESDLIQMAARAYGDALITQRFAEVLSECDNDLKPILEQIFTLYAVTLIERNLSWFLMSKTITNEQVIRVDKMKKRGKVQMFFIL